MDKKILYTLDLKFKRHNLNFDFDESSKTLTIGKNQNLKRKYLIGGIIVVTALFLAGLVNRPELPWTNLIKWFFILLSGFGFTIIVNAWKLSQNNKYKKVFSENSIKLVSKNETKEFDKEKLQFIDYKLDTKKDQVNGKMFALLKNGKKVDLLTLIEKNRKHLKSDFDYLSEIINQHIGLKTETE